MSVLFTVIKKIPGDAGVETLDFASNSRIFEAGSERNAADTISRFRWTKLSLSIRLHPWRCSRKILIIILCALFILALLSKRQVRKYAGPLKGLLKLSGSLKSRADSLSVGREGTSQRNNKEDEYEIINIAVQSMHKEDGRGGGTWIWGADSSGEGYTQTEGERDGPYVHETGHGYTGHITDC